MAEQLLDSVRDFIDGGSILISLAVGYFAQDMSYTLWSGLAGTAVVFLAVVPPWPFMNRNNIKWQPAQNGLAGIRI
ncbi:MAG: hypothetical protein Q9162_005040 [Coniocarpon cinnabarinum]